MVNAYCRILAMHAYMMVSECGDSFFPADAAIYAWVIVIVIPVHVHMLIPQDHSKAQRPSKL